MPVAFSYIFENASFTYRITGSSAELEMLFAPEANLSEISLLIPGKIVGATTPLGPCETSYLSGNTKLLCPAGNNIRISAIAPESVEKKGKMTGFSIYFPVLNIYKNLSMEICLPEGAVLANPKDAGIETIGPANYTSLTDGRRICFLWNEAMPELGSGENYYVYYEDRQLFSWAPLVAYGLIISSVFLMFLIFRKQKKSVLKVLDPDEKKIYEIVIRGKTTQNKIVREADMSKAKVSRILSRLESRGLVRRERRGRTNIVEAV